MHFYVYRYNRALLTEVVLVVIASLAAVVFLFGAIWKLNNFLRSENFQIRELELS